MKSRMVLGICLAMAVAAPATAATNLVSNGSFESGFSGWTVVPVVDVAAPVVIPYGVAAPYPGGAYGEAILANTVTTLSPDPVGKSMAYFSSDTANPHSLSQLISLVAGMTYNIGFDYYAPQNGINNPNDATLLFKVNGTAVGSTLQAGSGSGTPGQQWFNFGTSFTAGSTGLQNLSLEFRGLGVTAADFAVDRVYAVAAVPEPGVWAMMLFGFAAIGFSLRRRNNSEARVRFA